MLGKLLKNALKKTHKAKKPKDITAEDIRTHIEEKKKAIPVQDNDVQDNGPDLTATVRVMASNNAKNAIVVPDKTPALEEIEKTKKGIKNSIIEPKKEKNNENLPKTINTLKTFLGKELQRFSDTINKKIDTINDTNKKIMDRNVQVNKGILDVNKDALRVQKESLEEQKEAEYRAEHRYKDTLKNVVKKTASKGSSIIKTGVQNISQKVKGDSGILGMVAKVLGGAYLLKTFWPLIEKRLWPFIGEKVFPFIKEHLKEIITGLGIAKMIMDPIGTLKLLVKGLSKTFGTLSNIALKLGKFTAKGLYSLIKGTTKLALDGATELASMAKTGLAKATDLAKQGMSKAKDLAVSGIGKVKDLAMNGLTTAASKIKGITSTIGEKFEAINGTVSEKVQGITSTVSEKFGAFKATIGKKLSGMGEKIGEVSGKVKDIGSKLVEKGIGVSMKIGKGIGGVLKVLKPLAKIIPFLGIIVTVWDLLETFFPDFMTEVKSMFSLKKIEEIAGDIWATIKGAVSGIGEWISEKIGKLIQGYADILRNNDLIPDAIVDSIFGKDPEYEKLKKAKADAETAQEELGESGAIEQNTWSWSKDEIKDWSAVQKYRPEVLQQFIDSDNFSDKDNKKLQAIIDRKMKEDSDAETAREKAKKTKKETLGTVTGMKKDYGVPANSTETQGIKPPVRMKEFYMDDGKGGKVQITSEQNAKMSKVQSKLISAFNDDEKFKILLKEQEALRMQILEELRKPSDKKLKDAIPVKSAAADLGLTQFANGGWTGTGKEDDIAGIVHRNEYVLNQEMLQELDAVTKKGEKDNAIQRLSGGKGEVYKKALEDLMKQREEDAQETSDEYTINGKKYSHLTKAQSRDIRVLYKEQQRIDPFDFDRAEELDKKMQALLDSIENNTYFNGKHNKIVLPEIQGDTRRTSTLSKANKKEGSIVSPKIIKHKSRTELTGNSIDVSLEGDRVQIQNLTKEQDAYLKAIKLKQKELIKAKQALLKMKADPSEIFKKEQEITEAQQAYFKAAKDIKIGKWKEGKKAPVGVQEGEISYKKSYDVSSMVTSSVTKQEAPIYDNPSEPEIKPAKVSLPAGAPDKKPKALDIDKIKDSDVFTLSGSAAHGGFAKMNKAQKHNVKAMGYEYAKATGEKLSLSSAYRSVPHQAKLFNNKMKTLKKQHPDWSYARVYKEARHWVAPPGRSAHNTGLAVDIEYHGRGKKSPKIDKAISMGLFKKYGLKRPLAHESWHIVPENLSFEEQRRMANRLAKANANGTFNEEDIQLGKFRDSGKSVEPVNEGEISYSQSKTRDSGDTQNKNVTTAIEQSLDNDDIANPVAQQVSLNDFPKFDTSTEVGLKRKERYDNRFKIVPEKLKEYKEAYEKIEIDNASQEDINRKEILEQKIKYFPGLMERIENGTTTEEDDEFARDLATDKNSDGNISAAEETYITSRKVGEDAALMLQKTFNMLTGEGSVAEIGNSALTGLIDGTGFGNDLKGESEIQTRKSWDDRISNMGGVLGSSAMGLVGSLGGGLTNSLGLTFLTTPDTGKAVKNAIANTGSAIKGKMDKYGITDKAKEIAGSDTVQKAMSIGLEGLGKAKSFGNSILQKTKGFGANLFASKEDKKTEIEPGIAVEIPKAANETGLPQIRKTDKTGNQIKDSLSKDEIEIKPIRESNPDVGQATRKLAAKTSSRHQASQQQPATVINNITQATPSDDPVLSLGNTNVKNQDAAMIGTLF